MAEESRSASIARRSSLPGPSRCSWPTYSSSVLGLIRVASGASASTRSSFGAAFGSGANNSDSGTIQINRKERKEHKAILAFVCRRPTPFLRALGGLCGSIRNFPPGFAHDPEAVASRALGQAASVSVGHKRAVEELRRFLAKRAIEQNLLRGGFE